MDQLESQGLAELKHSSSNWLPSPPDPSGTSAAPHRSQENPKCSKGGGGRGVKGSRSARHCGARCGTLAGAGAPARSRAAGCGGPAAGGCGSGGCGCTGHRAQTPGHRPRGPLGRGPAGRRGRARLRAEFLRAKIVTAPRAYLLPWGRGPGAGGGRAPSAAAGRAGRAGAPALGRCRESAVVAPAGLGCRPGCHLRRLLTAPHPASALTLLRLQRRARAPRARPGAPGGPPSGARGEGQMGSGARARPGPEEGGGPGLLAVPAVRGRNVRSAENQGAWRGALARAGESGCSAGREASRSWTRRAQGCQGTFLSLDIAALLLQARYPCTALSQREPPAGTEKRLLFFIN